MKIYINGVKASKGDLDCLAEECKSGRTVVKDIHITPSGNLAITTY